MFASAATTAPIYKMIIAWTALAISTVLNAVYFMRMVLVIYTPVKAVRATRLKRGAENDIEAERQKGEKKQPVKKGPLENVAIIGLSALIIMLGTFSPLIIDIIKNGFALFD
jgi:multicomponent Na+:H+ antiporter subunit D